MDRRERSFQEIRLISPGLRQCVPAIAHPCVESKLTKRRRIHNVVRIVWEGALQSAQRRKTGGAIDWILMQAHIGMCSATLFRLLSANTNKLFRNGPGGTDPVAERDRVAGFKIRRERLETFWGRRPGMPGYLSPSSLLTIPIEHVPQQQGAIG
jgi:hypothetical protein